MKKPMEKHVRERVKNILRLHKYHYHSAIAGPYSTMGVEDDSACIHGRYVAIESKVNEKTKPTALQIKNANSVMMSQGAALLIHHGNIQDFEDWVNACASLGDFLKPPLTIRWPIEWL